jgi:hypothetical protein
MNGRSRISCTVTPYSLDRDRRFGVTHNLHLQGPRGSQARNQKKQAAKYSLKHAKRHVVQFEARSQEGAGTYVFDRILWTSRSHAGAVPDEIIRNVVLTVFTTLADLAQFSRRFWQH